MCQAVLAATAHQSVSPLVADDFKVQVGGLAGRNLGLELGRLVIVQFRFEQATEQDMAGPDSADFQLDVFAAVVANPPGTITPACDRLVIISPREAFLPPTISISLMPRRFRGITYGSRGMLPCGHGLKME